MSRTPARGLSKEAAAEYAGAGTRGSKRRGFIYFVTDMQFIKIGFASNWKRRLYELQVSNPSPLTPMLVYPGSLEDEGNLHCVFQLHCVHGEWFRPDNEIMSHINEMEHHNLLKVKK